jgi:hypothetical protein
MNMLLRVCGLLALAVAGASADEEAGSPVRIRWESATVFQVQQRLELDSKNKGATVFAGGAGRGEMIVKGHVAVTEQWTDKVTKEAEGRTTEVQRTYASSKIRPQKKSAVATSMMNGATILLTPGGAGPRSARRRAGRRTSPSDSSVMLPWTPSRSSCRRTRSRSVESGRCPRSR